MPRVAPLFALLAFVWAAPAHAGFKLKLTHLSDIQPVLAGPESPLDGLAAPPTQPGVLVCLGPPCHPADGLLGALGNGTPDPKGGTAVPPGLNLGTPPADPFPLGTPPAVLGGGASGGPLGPSGPEPVSAPGPSGLVLAGLGVLGLAGYGWRQRKVGAAGS